LFAAGGFVAARGLFAAGGLAAAWGFSGAARLPRFAAAFGLSDVRARAIAATLSWRGTARRRRAMLAA
jgi:hypothetical protein